MDFLITAFVVHTILSFMMDDENVFWPTIIVTIILLGLGSGDSDNEDEISTAEGKPAIVTEEKTNPTSQKKTTERLLEDETRVEWQDDNTKWRYNKGQTWETQQNF